MKKKLSSILIVVLFIFTSLTTLSTTGTNISVFSKNYETTSATNTSENNIAEFWAILVGSNPTGDLASPQWAKTIKNILCNYGWKEDHIKLLTGFVTKEEFFNACSWLKENSKASDTVLLALYDHGAPGYFCLYKENGEYCTDELYYEELDRELDQIECAGMGIIIEACFSGSAIPDLKQENRVVCTGTTADQSGGSFSRKMFEGLGGIADYLPVVGNQNGAVSIEELFRFCTIYLNNTYYDPQIEDDYEGELHLTFQNWSDGQIDQYTYFLADYTSGLPLCNKYQRAQSFIPSVNVLTKVQLFLHQQDDDPHPVSVYIRKNLTGENLTSISLIPVELIQLYDEKYVTFDFPDISVIPGETYYIVAVSPGIDDNNISYYWAGDDENKYDNGRCYLSDDYGKSWNTSDYVNDLFFITYGKNDSDNFAPIIPRRPAGSVFGDKNTLYNYYVVAEDGENDQIYYKLIWDDGNISDWLGPYQSNEIICFNHSWTEEGIYHIQVKVRDGYCKESDWSSMLQVCTIPNNPPARPGKPYIKDNWLWEKCYFANTTDPDGDVIYYNFSWGDDTYSGWIGAFDSGEEIKIYHSWSGGSIWHIKVKARDKHGVESDWSEPLILRDEIPPEVDILRPKKALYINNNEIRRYLFFKTLIIGNFCIEFHAFDNISKLDRLELYINGELKASFTDIPYFRCQYSYNWTRDGITLFRHRHIIKVVAFDNAGNNASKEIKVWKFL